MILRSERGLGRARCFRGQACRPKHGFDAPTREWAQFVSANRKRPSFSHDYDYVRGPVANDQVYTAFSLYEGGIRTFEMLIEQLKTRRLFDQILFHSPAALGCLKFIRSETVTGR